MIKTTTWIGIIAVAFVTGTVFSSPVAEAANPALEAIQQTLGLIQTETDKIQSVKDNTNTIRSELAIIKNDIQEIKAELQIVDPPTDPTLIGAYSITLDSPIVCTGSISIEFDQFDVDFVGTIPGELEIVVTSIPIIPPVTGTIEFDHSFSTSDVSENGEFFLDGQISQDLQTITGTAIADITIPEQSTTCSVSTQYSGIVIP